MKLIHGGVKFMNDIIQTLSVNGGQTLRGEEGLCRCHVFFSDSRYHDDVEWGLTFAQPNPNKPIRMVAIVRTRCHHQWAVPDGLP